MCVQQYESRNSAVVSITTHCTGCDLIDALAQAGCTRCSEGLPLWNRRRRACDNLPLVRPRQVDTSVQPSKEAHFIIVE